MTIPALAIEKERVNRHHIYLFYVDDNWRCFGHSAYYLSLLYPEFQAYRCSSAVCDIPCLCVPERYLRKMADICCTLVFDDYIQMDVPPTACYLYRDYDAWCDKLDLNECKPLILEH